MAYGKYKDLEKRTQSDKILRDKAFEFFEVSLFDQIIVRVSLFIKSVGLMIYDLPGIWTGEG